MTSSGEALKEITKIGNYAIPTFGVILTALFCIKSSKELASEGLVIALNFGLYTIAAAFVSYIHRLSFKRHQKNQEELGIEKTHLPLWAVLIFLTLHLVLIGYLGYKLWPLGQIKGYQPLKIDFLDIFSNLTVPVIGFLGVYIAWRQWNTAAYRFRLDLFEKRYVIYEAIIDFILSVRGGGVVQDEQMGIFKDKILPARFIFDNKIADYLNEIKEKSYDVQTYSSEAEGMPHGEERVATLRRASEAREWLYEQIKEKNLYNKLGPYLRITSTSLGILK